VLVSREGLGAVSLEWLQKHVPTTGEFALNEITSKTICTDGNELSFRV
jgi:hypothetical protein